MGRLSPPRLLNLLLCHQSASSVVEVSLSVLLASSHLSLLPSRSASSSTAPMAVVIWTCTTSILCALATIIKISFAHGTTIESSIYAVTNEHQNTTQRTRSQSRVQCDTGKAAVESTPVPIATFVRNPCHTVARLATSQPRGRNPRHVSQSHNLYAHFDWKQEQ